MGSEEGELRKRTASGPHQEAEVDRDGARCEEHKKHQESKKTIGRTPDGTGTPVPSLSESLQSTDPPVVYGASDP